MSSSMPRHTPPLRHAAPMISGELAAVCHLTPTRAVVLLGRGVGPFTKGLGAGSPLTDACWYTSGSGLASPAVDAAGSLHLTPTVGGRFSTGKGMALSKQLVQGRPGAAAASDGGRGSPRP
jgi:hypothetical protein